MSASENAKRQAEKLPWMFAVISFLIAVAIQLMVPYVIYRDYQFRQYATRTEGVVERVLYGRPYIAFETLRGEDVLVGSRLSAPWTVYELGQRLGVLYLPEDPYGARIDATPDRWALPVALSLFSAVAAIFGFGLILRIRRARRKWGRAGAD